MSILVENISKHFGQFQALDQVNLVVPDGKLIALLGPSGSGKSTLLRAIAGLESPDSGAIWINGQNMTHLDVQHRQIGFVFQHYALFKHLTVRQNIAFGLEIRRIKAAEIRTRVNELLDLIQLQGLGDRYPNQLSGGQRQRVALARALAVQPNVLLLDEPFGALDAQVRKDLRLWLRNLHHEVNLTSVFVTHDQEEALEVADQIVVMNCGKIEQVGTPQEIYETPATPFVMQFVGEVNVLPSVVAQDHRQERSPIFVRPHAVKIHSQPTPASLTATITDILHRGWDVHLKLQLSDRTPLTAHINRDQWADLNFKTGQCVQIELSEIKAFAPSKQHLNF
ncbi:MULTISPECIES: sulfate ABC transporter ATP-binding protein [Spirulina sp. CCY15215]|uniref:sulfate/molybdate ABC transporter ATP-binding protein n=1 Tax=Spirulina sp. CCY15215 TaxID=2767591 RepID=UPI00194DD724|nr:sulfate ABC transporter ATP-binding protein [Spirulina major]